MEVLSTNSMVLRRPAGSIHGFAELQYDCIA